MVAVGHVQDDVAVVLLELGGLDGPVVEPRRALVLDDSTRNLRATQLEQFRQDLDLLFVALRREASLSYGSG